MKLINHTYDTLNECLYAMINGTVFWIAKDKLYYNKESSCFCVNRDDRHLNQWKTHWQNWQVQAEPDWRDDLPKGTIPCEVLGGLNPDVKIDKICDYIEGLARPYIGLVDDYTHATPIQEKNCWRPE